MAFDLSAALSAVRALATRQKTPKAVLLPHDNPDPDSLASALGLERLLAKQGISSVIALGGIVGRPENRAMVRELEIPLVPVEKLDWSTFALTALIDTQPGGGNNSLPQGRRVDLLIDHHPRREGVGPDIAWCDVREEAGATAMLVYDYLRSLGLPIDARLATAFLYALKSETRDLSREAGPTEREAYVALLPVADLERLQAIVNPKVGREHFRAVDRALRCATLRGELLTVNLGTLHFPDLVAEVADLLLPYERAHYVLCVGEHEGTVYLSLRSDRPGATAGALIRRVVGKSGAAGGHGLSAGGRLHLAVADEVALEREYLALVARFCSELGIVDPPIPLL
jgi:nanoRNase/pAp phosphatase (c-di-AMP/oligoRNAs hydrolase)